MPWKRLEQEWERWKDRVRQRWDRLTEADLESIQGNQDRLAGKLLERYGFGKQRAEHELEDFLRSLNDG